MKERLLLYRHLIGIALLLNAIPAPAAATSRDALATTWRALADPASKHVIVVAHRGCWQSRPENSLAGLNACVQLGVDAVELDVRHTRDGVAVIVHDETVDRTTNGHGHVADLSWAEIAKLQLRAGHGGPDAPLTRERVPTLDQYLAAAKDRIMIVFDVKDGSQRSTFATIQRAQMADQAIFFYECNDTVLAEAIAPFRDKVTTFPIIFGKDGPLAPAAMRCGSNPAGWAHVKWNDANWLRSVSDAQRQNPVRLWTATMLAEDNAGFDDLRALSDPDAVWGAQIAAGAGMIMTNQPAALMTYLDRQGRKHRPRPTR